MKNRKPKSKFDKESRQLSRFGSYLTGIRSLAGQTGERDAPTLKSVSEGLDTEQKFKITQSLLAKYENGRIQDPSARVLIPLARYYNRPYLEVVIKLAQDKYKPAAGWGDEERMLWELMEKIILDKRPEKLPLKMSLRSRQEQIRLGGVLDVAAIAHWQNKENYQDLEQFWVVAPTFLDDMNNEIFQMVLRNIKAGVIYTYFIYAYLLPRFQALRAKLAEELKDQDMLDQRLRAYYLGDPTTANSNRHAQLTLVNELLGTVYMMANPHRLDKAEAYQCIRVHGETVLALSMDMIDIRNLYKALCPLTDESNRVKDAPTP